MSKGLFLLIALLLGVVSLGLLVLSMPVSARVHYMTQNRLRNLLNVDAGAAESGFAVRLAGIFNRVGLQRLYDASSAEVRTLVNHAGIYRPELRAMVHGGYVVSPWLFAMMAVGYTLLAGTFAEQGLGALLWGALFGYLMPRYLLRYMASRRARCLREESLVMIHLLLMLFEAGLSIEQALRTLRDRAGILLPHIRYDLDRILKRIEAGMERTEALDQWYGEVGVREVADLAEMLSQVSRQGGNIQKSLSEMVVLMEDRSRTELREKVGKLSGKMTVVMVLFLFPALMIFVAGPGVISIADALGGMR